MAGRGMGLAGIVSSPTVATVDRSGLSSGMRGLLGALTDAGYGDVGFNSGYRNAATNSRVRGAKGSQHLTGNAGDFAIGGLSPDRVNGMMAIGAANGVNGIGLYGSGRSLHMDTRNGPRAMWGVNGSYHKSPASAFPAPYQAFATSFYGNQPITAVKAINNLAPLPAAKVIADRPVVAAYVPERRSPVAATADATGFVSPGMPSIPAAPAPGGFFSGDGIGNKALGLAGPLGAVAGGLLGGGSFKNRAIGAAVGGLLGTALAGPVGGLLGTFAGRGFGNSSYGTPSNAASAALNAGWDGFSSMTSTQANAARNAPAGGGSAAWGGGGGLLGGLGGLLGGLFGGTTSTSSTGKGTTGRTGDGGWGNSPNVSKGGGGVSDGGKKK